MIADMRAISKLYRCGLVYAAMAMLTACSQAQDQPLSGYAEVDAFDVSHSGGGMIEEVLVRDGETVRKGQALMRLSTGDGQSALRAADARVSEARSDLDFAEAMPHGAARDARMAGARARIRQAASQRDTASRSVADLMLAAPRDGRIERIYFQAGERLVPLAPAVSVVPEAGLFVRTFIPESRVAELPVGSQVRIDCAECGAGIAGRVRWVAAQPEFAPPMIQTRESQSRMTYRADIALTGPARFHPGETVSVVPVGRAR